MNQAAIEYANISAAQEGKFTGSKKTITKNVVNMIADSTRFQRAPIQFTRKPLDPKKYLTDNHSWACGSDNTSQRKPPFLHNYNSYNDNTEVK